MNHYQIIALLLCILIIIYLKTKWSKQQKLKVQNQALKNVKAVKQLIHLIQQHRGMAAAYLNGDTAIHSKIKNLRRQIEMNTNKSRQDFSSENERWKSFLDHWQRLGTDNALITVDNSFSQHTALISNLLYLVEDEAEKGLLFSEFLPEFPQASYIWREVIGSTELIGQARAIGVGVATQKLCKSTDNIRLNFLQQQIRDVKSTVLNELYCLPHYTNEHNKLIRIAQEQIEQLINTIDQEFINVDQVTLNQIVYFEQATKVIKSIDDVFEQQVMQIGYTLGIPTK